MPLDAIRTARDDDIPWLVGQEQRPDFAEFIHRWPTEQHLRNLADADKLYLIAQDEAHERIAFVILAGLSSNPRDVELVRMAVVRPGAGIGTPLLAAVIDMAFCDLGASRLWLDVFDDNLRARHAYETAGFHEEAVPPQPARKSDGKPGSLVIMSIREAQYRVLRPDR
jgi:diamine N-acetyltransferase